MFGDAILNFLNRGFVIVVWIVLDSFFEKIYGEFFLGIIVRDVNLWNTDCDFRFECEVWGNDVSFVWFGFEVVVEEMIVDNKGYSGLTSFIGASVDCVVLVGRVFFLLIL